jgi:hypothetical protein
MTCKKFKHTAFATACGTQVDDFILYLWDSMPEPPPRWAPDPKYLLAFHRCYAITEAITL